ncbi:MAG: alpha/beta hydrolase, partial [Lachnospiraceae bacterium]|nr:alpha/beta hydrolase [Lachnospiraceae bacterium]
MQIMPYSQEIRNDVLIIQVEKAHYCFLSVYAFEKLTGENKELMIIPGAVHTDLYDRMDVIPFDKLESFFKDYLR